MRAASLSPRQHGRSADARHPHSHHAGCAGWVGRARAGWASAALAAALFVGFPAGARAQDADEGPDVRGVNAHRVFFAAWDGDLRDPLFVQRPGRMRQWDGFIGAALEYAHAPLVRYEIDGAGVTQRANVIDHLVSVDLSAGVTFHERFRLDLAVPIHGLVVDSAGVGQGGTLGDMRLTGLVSLVMPDEADQGFGLGLYGNLDLPTGADRRFLGERTVGGGAGLAATIAAGRVTATGSVGARLRPTVDLYNIVGADQFEFGLGFNVLASKTIGVGLEASGAVSLLRNATPLTESPIEIALTLRHRQHTGLNLLFGGATGLTRGVGAARARLFLGVGFGRIGEPPPPDTDGDGIVDPLDACPTEPEVVNAYRDDDGCPDALARLSIRALYDGVPVPDAALELTFPAEERTQRGIAAEEPWVVDRQIPGTMVELSADGGPCLAGGLMRELAEGDNTLDVLLRPQRPAVVRYEVLDEDGGPVAGAAATWRVETSGCAEPGGYEVLPTGTIHPIGPGRHTVFVEAEGYRVYRGEVVVKPGGELTVRAVMRPARVQVGAVDLRILDKVYFESDSAIIDVRSFDLLDEVADTLLAESVGKVRIEGHTDDKGRESYNLELSRARAEAVRTYLIGRGVAAADLIAEGFGETRPIATNRTESGRAQNRRVAFVFLDAAGNPLGESPRTPVDGEGSP